MNALCALRGALALSFCNLQELHSSFVRACWSRVPCTRAACEQSTFVRSGRTRVKRTRAARARAELANVLAVPEESGRRRARPQAARACPGQAAPRPKQSRRAGA
eukprot:6087772-Pleurochrysis_carterae.AAC.4